MKASVGAQSMKKIITRTKWPDLGKEIECATKWMETMGMNPRPSRIGAYAKSSMALAQDEQSAILIGGKMSKERFAKRVELSYETQHIPRIYRAFAGKETPGLRRRLDDFLAGPMFGTQENTKNASNRGRNTGFELSLGALLVAAGMDVHFPEDPDNADLIVQFNGVCLLIECKRPQTLDAVGPRLREGFRQLAKRYDLLDPSRNDTRGLVAMALGKAFNPDMQLLPVCDGWVLKQKAEALGNELWSRYQDAWQEVSHRNTVGVLLNVDFPVIVESENLITYCADSIVTNTPAAQAQDVEFLREFAKAVETALHSERESVGSNQPLSPGLTRE